MLKEFFILSGFFVYLFNYVIGWLLKLKKISVRKKTHQIFYASIIVNLIALIFLGFESIKLIMLVLSLLCMLILPVFRKGEIFHVLLGTAGLFCYLVFLYFNFF